MLIYLRQDKENVQFRIREGKLSFSKEAKANIAQGNLREFAVFWQRIQAHIYNVQVKGETPSYFLSPGY